MTFHAVQSMKNYEFTAIDGQLSAAPISNPGKLLYFTAGSVYKKKATFAQMKWKVTIALLLY